MECGKLHGRRRRHLDVVQHDPAIEPRQPTLGIERPECAEVALAARVLADLVRVRVTVRVTVRVRVSLCLTLARSNPSPTQGLTLTPTLTLTLTLTLTCSRRRTVSFG